jgi:4-alpha-glucanotransferase
LPPDRFEQLLDRAAAEFGIQPGYWDIWGRYRTTPAATIQAILRAKGVPADTEEQLEEALTARARAEWERLLPPVLIVSEEEPRAIPVNLPVELAGQTATLTVRAEGGETIVCELNLGEAPQVSVASIEGVTYVRRQAELPGDLPLGYHSVTLAAAGHTAETRYIVTPTQAWSPPEFVDGGRAAGIAISLYGIRSASNWGCGDFRDLLEIVDWAAEALKASFVGLNPLHAIHNRRPFNTSPYLPNSTFCRNFIYLDVEGIDEYSRCARAQALRDNPAVRGEIEQLRSAPFVEYERVSALKLRFLKLLFLQFLRECRGGSKRNSAFEAFVAREGEYLEHYATYSALDEHLHRRDPDVWVWPQWPEDFQAPGSPAVQEFQKKHWRSVLFYKWVQWQVDLQLENAQRRAAGRQMPLGLFHDLALATDRYGSDLWAYRPFFSAGCRVGSPPDDFSPVGQDWGFPPPNSEHHREDGYRYFCETIRRNCRPGGALRIDHVMRLFRLYWIPDGSSAADGAYVRERSLDYLRLLALESIRNQVLIVGEDLGTVEPEVRATLSSSSVFSYRLLYFERDGEGAFKPSELYPRQALVSSTTHDLPTLAGFWVGADIEARREAGLIDASSYLIQKESRAEEKQKMIDVLFESGLMPEHLPRTAASYPELSGELHHAIVGFLALAPSQLFAVNQEDLTKETAQQNLPGTTWQYPNWGRKMRYSIEDLRSNAEALAFIAMFRDWIVKTNRNNAR